MNTREIANKTSRRFVGFVDEFRKLRQDINASQIVIFLLVAGKDGITMKELERLSGMSNSTVSRTILYLSEVFKAGEPGLDLVEAREDINDRRIKRVYLKPRGRKVYDSLVSLLGA